jgi:hypothetical protein
MQCSYQAAGNHCVQVLNGTNERSTLQWVESSLVWSYSRIGMYLLELLHEAASVYVPLCLCLDMCRCYISSKLISSSQVHDNPPN